MSETGGGIYRSLARIEEAPPARIAEIGAPGFEKKPFVVRGLVREWPLVRAGLQSTAAARAYLLERRADRPFAATTGPAGMDGRIHYDDHMAVNAKTERLPLPEIFRRMEEAEATTDPPIIYLTSVDTRTFFPAADGENRLDLGGRSCLRSIWIGLRTRVAAHNDFPDNVACVAVGRRRFTLFPPDQFKNLYVGPLDNTPAGRPISMVDFHNPDFERFPRFREALSTAQTATLQPGDAIFIPSMWWHEVESLAPFNVMINYWWRDTPRFLGQPQDALHLAIMAIRDLPDDEKKHWRDLFDHYVFGDPSMAAEHIPPAGRGILSRLTPETAGRIRAYLLRALNQ